MQYQSLMMLQQLQHVVHGHFHNKHLPLRLAFEKYTISIVFISGCKVDVTSQLDRQCSGRRSCEVSVPNSELDATNPCFKELKTYLQAGFSCVGGKNVMWNESNQQVAWHCYTHNVYLRFSTNTEADASVFVGNLE